VLRPELVDLAADDWRIVGELELVGPDFMLRHRPAKLKAKDKLRAWVTHAALNAAASTREHPALRDGRAAKRREQGAPPARSTLVVGLDRTLRLRPLADANEILRVLVRGYREGLCRPLPFFESASCAFAEAAITAKKSPLDAATEAFFGSKAYGGGEDARKRGDNDDAYVALCVRDRDPFAEDLAEFERLALAVWQPALAAMEELES
jgi:exodeoxyribonuclease V gamma subunit